VAGRDGRFFILLDDREVKADFPSVADPLFSPDGKRLAFRGIRDTMELFGELPPIHKSDGRQCMVVDGEPGEDNQSIWKPHFSPDSRRLIYSMKQKERWILVFGTEKFGKEFDHVGEPAVSPDGSRFAFVAEIEDGSIVVSGDQRSERFDDIYGAPVFSPDGKKVAFGARKGRELWWKVMEVK
jgi:Tol biopolymer transport system component